MTLNLSELEFSSDFATFDLPDGNILYFYQINENIDNGNTDIKIDRIMVVFSDVYNETDSLCSSVIGFSNDVFSLDTAYTEYSGKILTTENIQYCTMEIYE